MNKLKVLMSITMLSLSCGSYAKVVLNECDIELKLLLASKHVSMEHIRAFEKMDEELVRDVKTLEVRLAASDLTGAAAAWGNIEGILANLQAAIPTPGVHIELVDSGRVLFNSDYPVNPTGTCATPENSFACLMTTIGIPGTSGNWAPSAQIGAEESRCGVGFGERYNWTTYVNEEEVALRLGKRFKTDAFLRISGPAPARS